MFLSGAAALLLFAAITLASCERTPGSDAHLRVLQILERRQYPEALRLVEAGLQKKPLNGELLEDRLILLLANGNRDARNDLLDTQKRLDALGRGRQLLIEQARNPQGLVRQQVAWLLGALQEVDGSKTLHYLAEDPEPDVRSEAIRSLARAKVSNCQKLLMIRLRDTNWMVRAEAAGALGTGGDPQATAQLFRAANDKDAYVRSCVLDALCTLANLSQKPIYLENLQAKQVGRRIAAALVLQKLGQPEAVSVLTKLLQDRKTPDRGTIAAALAASQLPSLASIFENLLLQEKDAAVRQPLLEYLQHRGDSPAMRILQKSGASSS